MQGVMVTETCSAYILVRMIAVVNRVQQSTLTVNYGMSCSSTRHNVIWRSGTQSRRMVWLEVWSGRAHEMVGIR
jgi:hypothetical protein